MNKSIGKKYDGTIVTAGTHFYPSPMCNVHVQEGLQKFTWFFNVSEAECGGDSGDRVKGEGEEDGDSKPRRVQHTD